MQASARYLVGGRSLWTELLACRTMYGYREILTSNPFAGYGSEDDLELRRAEMLRLLLYGQAHSYNRKSLTMVDNNYKLPMIVSMSHECIPDRPPND